MLIEHVFIPFKLDKTSKIYKQLAGSIELKGEGWYCCLKEFSLEKKWSLINETITIVYTNGYKSTLKPIYMHSVEHLDMVLEEMFGKIRPKRSDDIFDEVTFNTSSAKEEEREVTPPPSMFPFDFTKKEDHKTGEKPKRPITPPPSLMPFDLPPQKPKITDERMQSVKFPSDEPGKAGEDKYYIVYKNFKDAFLLSPELPPRANYFTEYANNSVKFTFNAKINRYEIAFDPEYVRGIHLSNGFQRALGFKEAIFNNFVASSPPKKENLHSRIKILLNDIVCPIYCGPSKEPILNMLTVSSDSELLTHTPQIYLKVAKNRIDAVEIEFKDFYGNPIFGAGANGFVQLEFKKNPK